MKRLLSIEWTKLYYYKSTRIFTALYFVLLLILGLATAYFKPSLSGFDLDLKQLGFFNYPSVWQNITYIFSVAKLFLGVIILMNITNEYTNGTFKQNLIDGLSKKEFLLSKLLTNFILAIASVIMVSCIILVSGALFSNSNTSFTDGIDYLFAYFIKLIFFFSFCLFLGILLKKSVFALLGFFVWWIAELIILLIEFVSKTNGKDELAGNVFLLSDYLPLNASSNLISLPKVDITRLLTGQSAFLNTNLNWTFVVVSIVYTGIFIVASNWLLKKRDL